MSESDLMDMYDFATKNTAAHDVTGLTVYYKRNFCHIREGDPNEISKSVVRTEQSPWHYNLSIVFDDTVDERLFSKWFFAFKPEVDADMPSRKQLFDLKSVLDHPKLEAAMADLTCRSFVEAFLQDLEPPN